MILDNLLRTIPMAIAICLGLAAPVAAEPYPTRPITLLVGYPAGGPSDAIARVLADGMQAVLHQPVVIENVGGASGSIAAGRAARATPDGYTLIAGNWGTHVINPAVYTLPYDVVSDFVPVGLFSDQPLLIVGRKTLPPNDLRGLVAWLKEQGGKATAGGAGAGSANNIARIFFENKTGAAIRFVPYRGGVQAMQDMLAGQIDLIFDLAASSLPQIAAGSIKPYAVMASHRLDQAPAIPTVDEAGAPGVHVSLWTGVWAPKGTPPEIVDILNKALRATLDDKDHAKRFADLGQVIPASDQRSPEALAALQKAEIVKWWPIVKAAGIKAD